MNRDTLAGRSCPSSLAPRDATTALHEIERSCDVVARQAGNCFPNVVTLVAAFTSPEYFCVCSPVHKYIRAALHEARVNGRMTGKIGIGAAVTRRPLPHHRAYGSVHGGSSWLR